MFDAYLRERGERLGGEFVPFDPDADYHGTSTGRPRADGVRDFLASRGIELPEGAPGRPAGRADRARPGQPEERAAAAGDRPGRRAGLRGLAALPEARPATPGCAGRWSPPAPTPAGARRRPAWTGTSRCVVDGITVRSEHLRGKPAPDTFLAAADRLGVGPDQAAVFEDATCRRRGRPGRRLRLRRRRRPDRARGRAARARRRRRGHRPGRAAGGGAALMDRSTQFPVEPWRSGRRASTWTCWRRPSRCSRCPTGTSACAATWTRASRTGSRAPTSTRSTSCARCRTPRPATAIPESGQTVVNVTNGKLIRLLVDDEPFDVRYGELHDHERVLDLRAGTLTRTVDWTSPAGSRVRVRSTRLVSLPQRAVAAIEYVVEAVDGPVRVDRAVRAGRQRGPAAASCATRPAGRRGAGTAAASRWSTTSAAARAVLVHRTRRSDLQMAAGHGPRGRGARPGRRRDHAATEDRASTTVVCRLEPGQRLRLVKFLAYGWSSLRSRPALRRPGRGALTGARYSGFDGLLAEQRAYLDDFWDAADVEVDGDAEMQQAVRFGMFHVLQAGARAERRAIPAKGLTGPGYDGHTFWDTEAFVLPVLDHTLPEAAADALRWRLSTLDLARDRADDARAGRGRVPVADDPRRRSAPATGRPAPPRSTSTPTSRRRSSGYRVGHRGRARCRPSCGLEMLVETARLWMSLGHHEPRRAVAHRRRHRAGRVHRDGGRQRLHEPGRGREPARRPRTRWTGTRRWPSGSSVTERGGGGLAGRGRGRAHPVRRAAAGAPAVATHFTDLPEWDFDRNAALPAAAARAVLRPVPPAGDQAGRPGAGDALVRRPVQRRGQGPQRRLLRAAHGPGLLAVGVHPGRDARPRSGTSSWPTTTPYEAAADRPARPAPQHRRRAAHRLAGRGLDRAGGRVRRAAGLLRRAGPRPGAAGRDQPAVLRPALAGDAADRRGAAGPGDLLAARRRATPRRGSGTPASSSTVSVGEPVTRRLTPRKPLLPPPEQPPGRVPLHRAAAADTTPGT